MSHVERQACRRSYECLRHVAGQPVRVEHGHASGWAWPTEAQAADDQKWPDLLADWDTALSDVAYSNSLSHASTPGVERLVERLAR